MKSNQTATAGRLNRAVQAYFGASERVGAWLALPFALGLRLYVAQVFWRSGWIKLSHWDGTLYLFHNDYHVPVLPPDLAAVLGTAGELGFSTLLAFGLLGRAAALGLFFVNLVAANSFPDISDLGLADHWLWGALLAALFVYGPGGWALDAPLRRWLGRTA